MVLFNLVYELVSFYRYLVTCDAGDTSFIFKLGAVKVNTGVIGDNIKGFKVSVNSALFQHFPGFFSRDSPYEAGCLKAGSRVNYM